MGPVYLREGRAFMISALGFDGWTLTDLGSGRGDRIWKRHEWR